MEMVNLKAMTGSIPAPNSGSIMEKIRKILVTKWGKPTKKNIKIFFSNLWQPSLLEKNNPNPFVLFTGKYIFRPRGHP
jgi:hypothetical protein